jgi:HK97 gp10 family phage protein
MGMAVRMNVAGFKEALRAKVDTLHAATRPAAQAGAQIIYERARLEAPVSDKSHYFYIRGKKYGPYAPGTLRDSIYQVFSKDNSYKDVSTYHISFNKSEAPYGFIVHNGTSRTAAHPFISKAVVETRTQVRAAIKARYLEEVNK